MRKLFVGLMVLVGLTSMNAARGEEPSARPIPGLTAVDQFQNGCVDCHVNMPDRNMDVRLSTRMKQWYEAADPKLLEKAQAAAPATMTLKGKHPKLPANSFGDIPGSCLDCHRKDSNLAPPMGQMLHLIHLTGGSENHFVAMFGGECTHCHKLNTATGQWSIPSGPEK